MLVISKVHDRQRPLASQPISSDIMITIISGKRDTTTQAEVKLEDGLVQLKTLIDPQWSLVGSKDEDGNQDQAEKHGIQVFTGK